MSKNKNKNNSHREEVMKDAELFSMYTFKRYWKKNKKDSDWDGKKEAKKDYFAALMEKFPSAMYWMLREGYKQDELSKKLAQGIMDKFRDPWFCERLLKKIKKGEEYRNQQYLPIYLREIIRTSSVENEKHRAAGDASEIIPLDTYYELISVILEKKVRKMVKAGIDEQVAFNLRCVIPCDEILNFSSNFRIYSFFDVLYDAAKEKEIPFDKIMKTMIPEDAWNKFILYALLERKEKYGSLDDKQKKFYMDVTNWVFSTMEDMDRSDIDDILGWYIDARRRDEKRGKDSNRRYSLSTLGENEYAHIVASIKAMLLNDASIEKYL